MKLMALLTMLVVNLSAQTNQPVFDADKTQLLLHDKVLLDSQKDGYLQLSALRFAPAGRHFFVLACGFECTDNVGFIFNADGTGKRKFTARWDWILQDKVEWSADSRFVYYYRINSTGADPPPHAPREGWMQVAVKTGAKSVATSRQLQARLSYAVFRLSTRDALNIRRRPSRQAAIVGTIPPDGKDIQFAGETQRRGTETWVKIRFGAVSGWVKQSYLYEAPR